MPHAGFRIERVLIDRPPVFPARAERRPIWDARGDWPCAWIAPAEALSDGYVFATRRLLQLNEPLRTRIHVSADERYELFIDGERVARGPEVGERACWFYDTFDLDLAPGEHAIVARVWGMGCVGRWAMGGVKPGFLLCPEEQAAIELLGTGVAPWDAKVIPGYRFTSPSTQMNAHLGAGAAIEIDGRETDWLHPTGHGDGWACATTLHDGNSGFFLYVHKPVHLLQPAMLPAQMSMPFEGMRLIHAEAHARDWCRTDALNAPTSHEGAFPVTLEPNRCLRLIYELDDYCCFYPQIETDAGAGATISTRFAETLYKQREDGRDAKLRSTDLTGAAFRGFGDTFHLDGSPRTYEPLWWRCGRFIELIVRTAEAPVTIRSPKLIETRYPFEPASRFDSSDPSLNPISAICVRSLQMCMHETYMDCPYYEQLMYAGDTRIQILTHYALSADDKLARKALRMFDVSRANPTGLSTSNTPSPAGQIIPPFSLWWVCMIHDFAMWRDDRAFVRSLLPGARAVVDQFLARIDAATGLARALPGWNYVDTAWPEGVPTDGHNGFSGVVNLQLLLTLQTLATLETYAGEPELAAHFARHASALSRAIMTHFWDDVRGLVWDDLARTTASQHGQCLALLAGALDASQSARALDAIIHDSSLLQARPYFLHYIFDTYARHGRVDQFFAALQPWYAFLQDGMKTTPEHFQDGRSDCHAWSAHPAYHFLTTVAGIRPAAPGFAEVAIRPQLGSLTSVRGRLAHPRGFITLDVTPRRAVIELPDGVEGFFVMGRTDRRLTPGSQTIDIH